jgi:hypothetical protein
MNHAPEHKCNQRNDPTEHEHTNDIQATEDHTVRIPEFDDNNKTVATSSTLQNTGPKHQQQTCSDNQHLQYDTDNETLALESERQSPGLEEHRERESNGKSSSIQLPEYRDDRDSAIIHLGAIGTHEGKTFIPKRSVHRNALDDLAHPYREDQDFFVLDLNLDGDQIDDLISNSKIYNAGGGYHRSSAKDCKLLTCPSADQRNAYQNSTTP